MVSPLAALCTLVLALLGAVPSRAGLRACNVSEVLRHYRAVIFEDLQAVVRLVGPRAEGTSTDAKHLHLIHDNPPRQGWPGPSCGAQKEHSVLLSIASLGRTLRGAVSGGRRGALEKAAWTVAMRTEAVMRRHCWAPRQRSPRPRETRRARPRGSQKRLLLRALDAFATCWEKLFALRASTAPPWPHGAVSAPRHGPGPAPAIPGTSAACGGRAGGGWDESCAEDGGSRPPSSRPGSPGVPRPQ